MLKQVLGDSTFRQLLVKLAQVVNSECDKLQFSLEISYRSSTDIVGGAKDRRGNKTNITLHQRAIATVSLALRGDWDVTFTDLRQPW